MRRFLRRSVTLSNGNKSSQIPPTLESNKFPGKRANHFFRLAIMPSEAGLRGKRTPQTGCKREKQRLLTPLVFNIL
jgi:hypothetical protein